MSDYYPAVSALIFTLVALAHLVRLINRWTVKIGPYEVSMAFMGRLDRCCVACNLGFHLAIWELVRFRLARKGSAASERRQQTSSEPDI